MLAIEHPSIGKTPGETVHVSWLFFNRSSDACSEGGRRDAGAHCPVRRTDGRDGGSGTGGRGREGCSGRDGGGRAESIWATRVTRSGHVSNVSVKVSGPTPRSGAGVQSSCYILVHLGHTCRTERPRSKCQRKGQRTDAPERCHQPNPSPLSGPAAVTDAVVPPTRVVSQIAAQCTRHRKHSFIQPSETRTK